MHGIHCIQSGCFGPCCIKSTAFNQVAFGPCCKYSTVFNHAAWNPLPSIGMLLAMLHILHCIQSGCIGPHCVNRTEYNRDPLCHNAWSLLHCMTLHGIHCIQSGCLGPCCKISTAFIHAAGIQCIQSCCIKYTSYNRVPLLHSAWNTLNSITLHGIQCIQ